MSGINNLQTRWRKDFFSLSVFFAGVCLVSEVLLYSADLLFSYSFEAGTSYRAAHFYLPVIVDALAIIAVRTRITSKNASNGVKNAWTCVLLLVICCSEQMLHYNCGALFCLPCLAVFMSALFADERISLRLTILGCISTLISGFFHARSGAQSFSVLVDINIGLIMLWMSYVATRMIIKYLREQFFVISNSSNREKDLLYKLRLDPLMGIYNRGGMDKIISQLIAGYDDSRPMSLIMIDLDHFKKINDTYGHQCGDEVLIFLADSIGEMGRKNVVPCRYGGEEVVIILKECTLKEAYDKATALLEQFRRKRFAFAPKLTVTFSAGLSEFRSDMSADEWIKKADENLYKAKMTGRNRVYPEFSFFYSISGRAQRQ